MLSLVLFLPHVRMTPAIAATYGFDLQTLPVHVACPMCHGLCPGTLPSPFSLAL